MVFVAVALFAALSYAFLRGSQGNVAMMTDEQAKVYAQQSIAYSSDIRTAVKTLLLRGCLDTNLDFSNIVWGRMDGTIEHPPGHNPNAPVTGCSIFAHGDGRIKAMLLPSGATPTDVKTTITGQTPKFGSGLVRVAFVPGIGFSSNAELVLMFWLLDKNVCTKINDFLGITNSSQAPPVISYSGQLLNYNGSFTNPIPATVVDHDGVISGKKMFCAQHYSSDIYVLVTTLIER